MTKEINDFYVPTSYTRIHRVSTTTGHTRLIVLLRTLFILHSFKYSDRGTRDQTIEL